MHFSRDFTNLCRKMHKIIRAFLLIILVISGTCNAKVRPNKNRKPAPHHEKQRLPVPTPKVIMEKVNKAQETIQTYWPKGVVHYFLDNFQYDYLIGRVVRSVFNYIETVSCVKFMPLINKPEKNEGYSYLYIANPTKEMKCVHAPVYNDNGEILVTIGYKCLQKREILHSILHGLGLRDEVTHPYRDQYVRVLWENIHPEYRYLFRLNTADLQAKHVSEYDPLSVMHFHDRAFSRNGRATIAPLMPGLLIQPSVELSQLDQLKLRMLFGHECNRREVGELLDTCKIAFHVESDNVKGHNGSHKGTEEYETGENDSNGEAGNETDANMGVIVESEVKNGTDADGHGKVDQEVHGKGGAGHETDLDEVVVHEPDGNGTVSNEADGKVGDKSDGKGGAGDKADRKAEVGNKSDGHKGSEVKGAEKHEDGKNKEHEHNDGEHEGVIVTKGPGKKEGGKKEGGKKDNAVNGNGRRRWWLQKWW